MANWKGMSAEERKAEMKRRVRARKGGKKTLKSGGSQHAKKAKAATKRSRPRKQNEKDSEDVLVAYALGHTKAWLEIFAESHGIVISNLTNRVGEGLRHR